MLDFRVETFLIVCQEMNFTRAARRLGITQPAVSKHIRQLEEYYDVLLFGYEGKKVYLTKEGKMLYGAMVSMHNRLKSAPYPPGLDGRRLIWTISVRYMPEKQL